MSPQTETYCVVVFVWHRMPDVCIPIYYVMLM